LISLEEVVIPAAHWSALTESMIGAVRAYHQVFPLRQGIPREELKSRLKLSPHIFNLMIHQLAAQGMLAGASKWVAIPEHRVLFSPFQQVKVDQLLAQFAASPLTPPSVKHCQQEAGEDIFNTLLDSGDLVAVSEEIVFRKKDYDSMVETVIQVARLKGKVTLAEVRDLLHASRRYTQALLEHLDAAGVTIRDGDYRRLKE
jgi:selenocysteine-specific elongation factor